MAGAGETQNPGSVAVTQRQRSGLLALTDVCFQPVAVEALLCVIGQMTAESKR